MPITETVNQPLIACDGIFQPARIRPIIAPAPNRPAVRDVAFCVSSPPAGVFALVAPPACGLKVVPRVAAPVGQRQLVINLWGTRMASAAEFSGRRLAADLTPPVGRFQNVVEPDPSFEGNAHPLGSGDVRPVRIPFGCRSCSALRRAVRDTPSPRRRRGEQCSAPATYSPCHPTRGARGVHERPHSPRWVFRLWQAWQSPCRFLRSQNSAGVPRWGRMWSTSVVSAIGRPSA